MLMCHRMTLLLFHVHTTRTDHEGDREVFAMPLKVIGKARWDPWITSLEGILHVLSCDMCRKSIALLSLVLAWLVEGSTAPHHVVFSKLTNIPCLPVQIHKNVLRPKPKPKRQWVYRRLGRDYKIVDLHCVHHAHPHTRLAVPPRIAHPGCDLNALRTQDEKPQKPSVYGGEDTGRLFEDEELRLHVYRMDRQLRPDIEDVERQAVGSTTG
ncbi:hypothetical protein BU25DRAFT_238798 [Macroventuria anomochaeta]|uniref:Uncharacterized protein n=1 Tax=Macroventuria anomochaeta TaxID=301207 RepID=A0ACB6RK69_9PLEO|nr:uncharacterized protein BU25DRAFT_238798 [Macroventuria anomochaeta]KAF2621369.1 hypothetical protein BU25DRAFT_238798 [Macroventuria anomochaeta]